jgi:hypothetical protein
MIKTFRKGPDCHPLSMPLSSLKQSKNSQHPYSLMAVRDTSSEKGMRQKEGPWKTPL